MPLLREWTSPTDPDRIPSVGSRKTHRGASSPPSIRIAELHVMGAPAKQVRPALSPAIRVATTCIGRGRKSIPLRFDLADGAARRVVWAGEGPIKTGAACLIRAMREVRVPKRLRGSVSVVFVVNQPLAP